MREMGAIIWAAVSFGPPARPEPFLRDASPTADVAIRRLSIRSSTLLWSAYPTVVFALAGAISDGCHRGRVCDAEGRSASSARIDEPHVNDV